MLQKGMFERLLYSDTFPGMNLQHPAEQIESVRGGTGKLAPEGWNRFVWQLTHEPFCLL